ncbi:MAG TPA: nucleotidyltransferase domain-containing protein [Salinivirgaceae bacterium]|nr:nucleotidyltransferase domain-containing protein [Salinivirgaceae bacterium]
MNNTEKEILAQIKKIVKEKDPSAKIYLYGSRSRGGAKSESDWDILILLNRNEISIDLEREITYPLYDLEFETGEIISPMLYTENDWNTKYSVTQFYKNVMREGKML